MKSFFRRFAKFCCGPLRILNVGSGYGQRRSENTTSEWAWGSARERQMLRFMSESALSLFFSKSFVISSLIFRSLNYFEFIFMYSIRECSNFILLHVIVQFS